MEIGKGGGLESRILLIRDTRVMLGVDLARVYGVTTKRLNEQVGRNIRRFPEDFMFRLTPAEKKKVVAYCDHLRALKYSPVTPRAFTEHGALMLANVLNSERAVDASIQVIRAFARLRTLLSSHRELARRLDELERRYDAKFKSVFNAIRELMEPPRVPPKPIGFQP